MEFPSNVWNLEMIAKLHFDEIQVNKIQDNIVIFPKKYRSYKSVHSVAGKVINCWFSWCISHFELFIGIIQNMHRSEKFKKDKILDFFLDNEYSQIFDYSLYIHIFTCSTISVF